MPGLLDVLRENSRGGLEHISLPVEADPATKAALVRLVAASPRLHTLKMEACCGGLRELLQHAPSLKELESSHVWQNEDEEARVLSDDDVRAVYECCPLLDKLDICHGDAEAVETDTWAALFDSMTHLEHVQMPRAENINHVVLAAIGRCKSLRCLYLQEFDCCDYGCARLAEESRLQELQLSPGPDGSDGGCTDQGVAFLCKIKSLRVLDFQSRPEEAPPLTDRTCDWVAKKAYKHCGKEGEDGVLARFACPVSCGDAILTYTGHPTPFPIPLLLTPFTPSEQGALAVSDHPYPYALGPYLSSLGCADS